MNVLMVATSIRPVYWFEADLASNARFQELQQDSSSVLSMLLRTLNSVSVNLCGFEGISPHPLYYRQDNPDARYFNLLDGSCINDVTAGSLLGYPCPWLNHLPPFHCSFTGMKYACNSFRFLVLLKTSISIVVGKL